MPTLPFKAMIYLDNAATSYPKPPSVIRAAESALRRPLGNPGRSTHKAALASAQLVLSSREAVAELFGADSERVIFTLNTTHALNLAIFGAAALLSPTKNTVLTDHNQHNSVLRPLYALESAGKIRLRFCNPRRLADAMDETVGLGVFSARSNVTGESFPLRAIGALLRQGGALHLCDAAQAAGSRRIRLEEDGIDLLCIPGHKGLLGIPGAGALLMSRSCPLIPPLISGGSGSASLSPQMPDFLPDRLEAGTPALSAIAAMGAGASFVKEAGEEALGERERSLGALLHSLLSQLPHLTLYSPPDNGGIVLCNVKHRSPHEAASLLDGEGICVRSGFHCAPLIHKALGTGPDGALRFSFGPFNTPAHAYAAARALEKMR